MKIKDGHQSCVWGSYILITFSGHTLCVGVSKTNILASHLTSTLTPQVDIAVRKLCLWHPSAITMAELKISRHQGTAYWHGLQEIVTGKGGSTSVEGRKGWDFDRSVVGLGRCKDEEEQVRMDF